jgi:Predicted nucleotide-binding protein containing TIR-like domain
MEISMHDAVEGLIQAGLRLTAPGDWRDWAARCHAFLSVALDHDTAAAFKALQESPHPGDWTYLRGSQVGFLEALRFKLPRDAPIGPPPPGRAPKNADPRKVFVVHGHDDALKESTARFLERIGLSAIILHEQANAGRTIIEKLEAFSSTGFAVVLLSPDDPVGQRESPTFRARQNVVLELGYFIGLLGRHRVCALYKPAVELPSDLHGVLYVPVDEAGGWRTKLAQELVEAGYSIHLAALLGG